MASILKSGYLADKSLAVDQNLGTASKVYVSFENKDMFESLKQERKQQAFRNLFMEENVHNQSQTIEHDVENNYSVMLDNFEDTRENPSSPFFKQV